jgi:hypothetical protein
MLYHSDETGRKNDFPSICSHNFLGPAVPLALKQKANKISLSHIKLLGLLLDDFLFRKNIAFLKR